MWILLHPTRELHLGYSFYRILRWERSCLNLLRWVSLSIHLNHLIIRRIILAIYRILRTFISLSVFISAALPSIISLFLLLSLHLHMLMLLLLLRVHHTRMLTTNYLSSVWDHAAIHCRIIIILVIVHWELWIEPLLYQSVASSECSLSQTLTSLVIFLLFFF